MKKASKMSGLASAFVILLLLTVSLGANDLALAANPGSAGGAPMSNSAEGYPVVIEETGEIKALPNN